MSSDSGLVNNSKDLDSIMKLLSNLSENQADLKKQFQDTAKEIEDKVANIIQKEVSLQIENVIKEIKADTSLQIQNAAKNIILDTNLNIIKAQESTLAFMKKLNEENSATVMTHSAIARKELRDVEASLNRKINTVNDNLKILIDEEVVRSTEAEMKIDKLSSKRFQDIEASWSKNIDVLSVVLDSIEDYNAFKVVISEKLYSKSNDPQVSIDSSNENNSSSKQTQEESKENSKEDAKKSIGNQSTLNESEDDKEDPFHGGHNEGEGEGLVNAHEGKYPNKDDENDDSHKDGEGEDLHNPGEKHVGTESSLAVGAISLQNNA